MDNPLMHSVKRHEVNSVQNNPCARNEFLFYLTIDDKRAVFIWSTGVMEWWSNGKKGKSNTPVLQYSSIWAALGNKNFISWWFILKIKFILDTNSLA